MNDAAIIGKDSPLVAYVKLSFNNFTTGEIPPKYILSFEVTKIQDKTGKFNLTILYAPNTFKRGDDYLGLKLASLFNKLNSTENADGTEFTIPCNLEYGWSDTGLRVTYKQAIISGFSENIEEGAFIHYTISGILNRSSSRASQTKITYDLNDDGVVNIKDVVVASKSGDVDLLSRVSNAVINGENDRSTESLDKIPAGTRLSDKIEFLAKYIFYGIYDVKVDHTDEEFSEDRTLSDIMTTNSGKIPNTTLYQKLVNMVNSCYSLAGYNVTYHYYKNDGTELTNYTEYIESDQSIEEDLYYKHVNLDDNLKKEQIKLDLVADPRNERNKIGIRKETTKEAVKGDRYKMFFIDGDNKKYGRPTLYIGPKSSLSKNALFAHYTISNTNRYNNVISYSHSTNLVPLITAFNDIFGNSSSDVDVDSGEYIFTQIKSLNAPLTKENAEEYAHNYALILLKHLDNVTEANLEVVFDRYSILLGIDDRISITNTVNGGETLFNGDYYITEAVDSLEGGLLKTKYSLLYTETDVEEYVKNKVLQLMYELKPDLKNKKNISTSNESKKRDSQVHGRYIE